MAFTRLTESEYILYTQEQKVKKRFGDDPLIELHLGGFYVNIEITPSSTIISINGFKYSADSYRECLWMALCDYFGL